MRYQKDDRSGQRRRSSNKKGRGSEERKRSNSSQQQFDFDDPDFWDNIEKELDFEESGDFSRPDRRDFGSERRRDKKRDFSDQKSDKYDSRRRRTDGRSEKNVAKDRRSDEFRRDNKDRRFDRREKHNKWERYSEDSDNDRYSKFETHGNRGYKDRREGSPKFTRRRDEGYDEKRKYEKRDGYEKPRRYSDREKLSDYKSDRDRRSGRDDRRGYSKPDFNDEKPFQGKEKEIRLNRFISNAGVCSRRDADDLILNGEIKVNGAVVTELGFKVNLSDKVEYRGKVLDPQKKVYLLLNKPKDTLTTFDDPEGRRTVYDIIKGATKERIYSVGRLDRNTTGLLLFTNNGDMATALTHPSNNIKKLYHVVLNKDVTLEDFEKLKNGIELEDGFIVADDISYANDTNNEIGIEIHSGRNRIVRRMFESLGYEVVKLDRVAFAGLTKKNLPRGEWRMLTPNEVTHLLMLIGNKK
ncbi:MAG TPA: pseudouridine synthase [Salinivirgaceae bacterium]|nr:pseudouridine synthase [Salinivirgaceae bacterium]HQA76331.1 pseudouridine synthase [Salinivirgaceae bacterium]